MEIFECVCYRFWTAVSVTEGAGSGGCVSGGFNSTRVHEVREVLVGKLVGMTSCDRGEVWG